MVRKRSTGTDNAPETAAPGRTSAGASMLPGFAVAPLSVPQALPVSAVPPRPPEEIDDLEQLLAAPLLLVGEDLRLRRYSMAAAENFHLLPSDVGRAIGEIDMGLATREIEVLLRDVIGRSAPLDHEVQDRRGKWFLVSAYPLRRARGGPAGAALVLVNIDRFKRTEQALRDSDRRKDEFIATLAHEIRSPLAALRDASELMNDRNARPGDVAQARGVMDRQIANMVRMADDLAELSRMQHGHLSLRTETVDLVTAVRSAAATTEHERRAAHQMLTLELPDTPVEILADAMRIEQMFTNLFGNASKATPRRGQILLSLEPAESEGTNEIKVRLQQNYGGFSPQPTPLPRVLDVVSAAPAPPTSRAAMSLGLYLARSLAELLGGTIEMHGAGSELLVRLPRQPGRSGAPAPASGDARRVLVVDDNVDAARIMAMVLGVAGHEVRLAHLGGDTVEAARAFHPDAVLLDIGLPDMDGYEVARRLRAEPGMEQVLLVAVTGYGREQDIRMSRAAGFDEHFTKPVSPDALTALIARKPVRGPATVATGG